MIALLVGLAIPFSTAFPAAFPDPVPTPVRLTADVDDAYALENNPGGLSFVRGSELRFVYGRSLPNSTTKDVSPDATNGLALFGATHPFELLTLAGAFAVNIPASGRAEERATAGLSFGGTKSGLGFALQHIVPSVGENKNVIITGLTIRPMAWLSAGIEVYDVGQTLDPRHYDLGLAIRPGTDRALLSSRWRTTQGDEIFGGNVDIAARAEIEPLDGVFLGGGANYVRRDLGMGQIDTNVGFIATLGLALEEMVLTTSLQDTTKQTELAAEVAYRSRPHPSVLARTPVAVIDLEGELVPEPSFSLISRGFEITPYGGVPILLEQIARGKRDEGVLLRIAPLSIGWAKAAEIRRLVTQIRGTGRRVDCELTGTNDLEYFIASACTTIMIPPALTLEVNGLARNVLFLGDALDQLGVKVDYVARGKYKSFPEQFTRSGMSPAEKEALSAYLDRLYETELDAIGKGRGLERAKVEEIIAKGVLTSTEAHALKVVDAVVYPDEIENHLNHLYGRSVSFSSPAELNPATRPHWAPYPRVAIVNIDASITGGESRNLPFDLGQSSGAQTIVGSLEAARTDPRIRAVVLRVDSPGGDAIASDLIARAVKLLDKQKPVIASFGDVAASGGYYVAANARSIYAESTSLTGSIGVFSIKVSFAGLIQKIGVAEDSIERGPLSNSQSPWRDLTPEGRAAMEREVDDIYERFLDTVANGRKKTTDEIRAIAEGRIWAGEDAVRNGLVDELGGLTDAIRRAKEEAGLDENAPIELVTLPKSRQPIPDLVRTGVETLVGPKAPSFDLGDVLPHGLKRVFAAALAERWSVARPLARAPFVLDVD